MPPRKNTSKQNLLEKAGRTFSIAQLELKRQRILTLVAWGTLVIVLVLFVGYEGLVQRLEAV